MPWKNYGSTIQRHTEEPHPIYLTAMSLPEATPLLPHRPMLFARQYSHVLTNNPEHDFVRTVYTRTRTGNECGSGRKQKNDRCENFGLRAQSPRRRVVGEALDERRHLRRIVVHATGGDPSGCDGIHADRRPFQRGGFGEVALPRPRRAAPSSNPCSIRAQTKNRR